MSQQTLGQRLALLAISLWVGGLLVCGYMVAPVIFKTLADKQLAGVLAGKIFTAMSYIGMGCALYLLAYYSLSFGKQALRHKTVWVITAMLLLSLVGHLGIQPVMAELKAQAFPTDVMQSMFAKQFKIWHGAASIIYLIQSLLGIVLVSRCTAWR